MKPLYFKLLSIILIFCLGTVIYFNTFHCSFHFDDIYSIVSNFYIKDIYNLQDIWNFWPCRFVTYFSIALNYHFSQLHVFGYHLFNLAVHLATAAFVWWLVRLTLSTPVIKGDAIAQHVDLIALLAGLVFVSHPVQTQAVTYIVQRAASMAALFYVASLCFYVKSRLVSNDRSTSNSREVYYLCSLLTAIMAMFTKEPSITLPLMILFYEFSFFRSKKSFTWVCTVPFLFALLIIPLTMFLTRSVNFQEMHRATEGPSGISSMQYLLTQFRVMLTYIRLLFLPIHQNLDYDYPISQSLFELPVLFSFLFLCVIVFAAKRLFSKYRLVSFSIFWFFLTLFPESSILPIRDVIYEHRLYLPMVGFSIFLVSGVYYLGDTLKGVPTRSNGVPTMCIVLTLIVTCNSVLTYQRNKVWKDEFTLWNDVVLRSPHKARPYNNRGNAYYDLGNFTKALLDLNKAIEINPEYADAYYSRGNVNIKQERFVQAIADYSKAIELNPADSQAYNNRGNAYDKEGSTSQAIVDYTKAIELNPHYTDAFYNRGYSYTEQNDFTQAMSDFSKVIELNPNDAEAYNNRGHLYEKQDNLFQAMSDYNEAIAIDPKYAGAYNNRGSTYNKTGNFPEAIADFDKAIEIDPKNALSYNNRGGIYAKEGKLTEAILDFNKAMEIDPKNAEAYYNAGLAADKTGNSAQAISDYNKAIELNPRYENAYYNRGSIYDRQGSFTQAVLDYNKAIEIDPESAEAYNNGGIVYAKQNNFIQAISYLTRAIKINPQNAEGYNNRGLTYAKQGSSTQALADYDQAIAIKPDYAAAYYNRALVYYQLKAYDKALNDVHKVEGLGTAVDPRFLNALDQSSGPSS